MTDDKTKTQPQPAKEAAAAQPAAPAKVLPPLSESEFHTSAEFIMPRCGATPPSGTKFEDVLKPAFWSNVRGRFRQFQRGCIVQIMPKDGSWYGEVIVEDAGTGYARVKKLNYVELDPAAIQALVPDGYDIQPQVGGKYRVIRKQGGVVIKTGLSSFDDALRECTEDQRRLQAA